MKHWLATIAALLCSITVSAYSFEVDGIYYSITSSTDLTVEVTYKDKSLEVDSKTYVGDIIIPEFVTYGSDTYHVTSIGYSAFFDCRGLTSVTIPESVTKIGGYAFYRCSITSVVIPESVTKIEGDVFSDCSQLISVTLPESIVSIGSWAFFRCNSLQNITIPEKVTSIAESTFSGCSSLASITIPEGVTSIGNYAFSGCSSLASITIPEGVTSIGEAAFGSCSSLTSITIPKKVTSIAERTFSGCSSLAFITIPEGVTSIGEYAFDKCSSLAFITVPESVTSIGNRAFQDCTGELVSNCNVSRAFYASRFIKVTISQGVTSIGDNTFRNCYDLTSITIPESVTSIGKYAFYSCYDLTSITCYAATPPNCESYAFDYYLGTTVYVPSSSVAAYKSAEGWKNFTNIQAIVPNKEILDTDAIFTQILDEDCNSISYARTFDNTNWQSLYVPFEIPYDNIKDDFDVAYINDVHQFDDNDDGTIDRTQVEAIKITSGVLDANYPYLIRAKEVGEKVITVEDATLYTTVENSIDCSSVYRNYTFTGSYRTLTGADLPANEGYYALVGGEWKQFAESAQLGAFRVYLKIDSRIAGEVAASAISLRIVGDEREEETTGIENAELKFGTSTVIYDLLGRRVENPTKGVYIVNGVKRVF